MPLLVTACRPPGAIEGESSTDQAVWTNGDFESDAIGTAPPTGWTVSTNLNPAITDLRPNPQTLASLNLANGGTALTHVVGGAAETQSDPDLGTSASLRFPKYGQRAVRVNSTGAGTGSGNNVNSIRQTMTTSLGDVDPIDNKVHVRFAVAPVLQNPGHGYTDQPYYFVRLQNLTKNQIIYQDFNASGQPGVPWKSASGGAVQYTDWQLVDVSPGNSLLAVGDQVELVVTAAGCAQGGHWGHVYVDAVGSGVPGIYTWATGPQAANAGSTITYTVNYKNGGTTTANGTTIDFVTPPNTTFSSVSLGGCTAPAAGATGTVTCPVGNLANGSTGSFQVTVNIPAGTANGTIITSGNYSIYATGITALLGPKVYTTVTSSVSYADVGVTVSDGVAALGWGQATTYLIDVTNAGPVAASSVSIADTMPAQLTGVTWTCAGSAGGTCTASGSGNISDTISLPVGAAVRYTVAANVIAGSGSGQVIHTVTATVGGGVSDPDSTNNTALDTNAIGTLRTLTFTKAGTASAGGVSSVPASISCPAGCSSGSGQFLDGSQVVLTAAPVAGATFQGWGGACSGTATTCTVTMSGDQAVTATFVGAPSSVTVSGGGAQSTTVSTAFAQPLAVLVTDSGGTPISGVTVTFAAPGSGASASLSSTTATTNASGIASVTATANATPGAYTVTATVAGLTPVSFALVNLGLPASISVTGGGSQSTTVGTAFASPLTVVVRDAANQAVPGATVAFAAPGSGATSSLSATSVTTDSSGEASVTATASTVAGSYSVTATVTGVTPASFSLTNTPGAAAAISVTGGGTQSAVVGTAFAAPLAVAVVDAHGNAVPGAAVTFTVPGSGATASLSSTSATTNSSGAAAVSATASTTAGSYTVTAQVADVATAATFSLTNTAGAPASIVVVSGSGQSATVATTFASALVVRVLDAHGNVVPGATVAFAAPGSGATSSLSATSVTTDSSGEASVTATASTVAGSYSVTATVTGVTPASFSLTNTPGAAAALSVTGGGAQSAVVATAFAAPLAVAVVDAHGNAVPGAAVTFTVPGSGATASLSSTSATTNSSGAAAVSATASTTAGSYAVTAQVAGVATAATFSLTNTAGAPASIVVVSGSGQSATIEAAFASSLVVRVLDAHGNVVPSATVTFAAPGAGASAVVTSSALTNAAGLATASATAGSVAGTYSVTAQVAGVATPATFTLTNTSAAPATLSIASGDAQSAVVTTAFAQALVVVVRDHAANPVSGVVVAFGAPGASPSATLSAANATTGADGTASVAATADTRAGSYQVVADAGAGLTAAFSLANLPGAPARVTALVAGTPQSATVLTAFAQPLVVLVEDAHGNSVPGATVSYQAPGVGASAALSAQTAQTSAAGLAQISASANATAGGYVVTAAVAGVGAPATFTLTNLAGAPATVSIVGGDAQEAEVDTDFADALEVLVLDGQGNPVPGATVTFGAAAGAVTATLSATSVATDSDGLAAVTAHASTTAGAHQATAVVVGAAQPAVFDLVNTPAAPFAIELGPTSSPQQTQVTTAYPEPLAVRVIDRFGNPVPGVTVTYAAPVGGATGALSSTSATTDALGAASVTIIAGAQAGSFQITATVAGIPSPGVFALQNLHGPAHAITVYAGGGQSATVATSFADALVALVSDAQGNPVVGHAVTFAAPGSGATAALAVTSAVTDAQGLVSTTAIAGTVTGTYDVTATAAFGGAPAAFALDNTPGAPATIAVVTGTAQQSAQVLQAFAHQLAVIVRDAYGNVVPGATVSFATVAQPGASLSSPGATTDADGIARVTAIADTMTGSYQVQATVAGISDAAIFDLTNTAAAPGTVIVARGGGQRTLATTPYVEPVVFVVLDAHGNPVPGVELTIELPSFGPGATMSHVVARSNAAGEVEVALVANGVVGAFTVTAMAPGAVSAAAAGLSVAPIPTSVTATAPASVPVDRLAPLAISVAASVGTPAGNVEIYDAAGALYATVALVDGLATIDVPLGARGQRVFTVRYPAQGSYDASAGAEVVVFAAPDAGTLSGSGCNAAGGGGGGMVLLWLLFWMSALGRALHRRRAAPLVALVAGLGALAPAMANAQSETRAVNRFHAPAADSEWIAGDSLTFVDAFGVALAQAWDYSRRPLVVYEADGSVRQVVIEDAVVVHTQASLSLGRGIRISTSVPTAIYQDGNDSVFNGEMLSGPKYAFGDMLLGGEVRLIGAPGSALRVAAGLRLTLPTGSRTHFMSDSRWQAEPRALIAATRGSLELAAEAGVLLRRRTELAGQSHGSELRYVATAGLRLAQRRLLVGAELFGATSLVSDTATGNPIEAGLGAHYALAPTLVLGLGITAGLVQAVGTPDYRSVLSASWAP